MDHGIPKSPAPTPRVLAPHDSAAQAGPAGLPPHRSAQVEPLARAATELKAANLQMLSLYRPPPAATVSDAAGRLAIASLLAQLQRKEFHGRAGEVFARLAQIADPS